MQKCKINKENCCGYNKKTKTCHSIENCQYKIIVSKSDDVFANMNDEEFLYQMSAFMGKDNFIRFVDIISHGCEYSHCDICEENCGEHFYKSLKEK